MATHDRYKNETERKFADYLDGRDIPFDYEPTFEGHVERPDFLAHTRQGDVVCEARELAWIEDAQSGARDPYRYVRNSIRSEWRQGAPAEDLGLPFVLVLGRDGLGPGPLDTFNVLGAMFGDIGVQFWVATDGGPPPDIAPSQVFGDHGAMVKDNRRTSALAIIREFNPTRGRFERELTARLPEKPELDEAWEAASTLEAEMTARGEYDPEARDQRVLVVHNVFADVPLPMDAFAGPYDEQHGFLGARAMQLTAGTLLPTLPR